MKEGTQMKSFLNRSALTNTLDFFLFSIPSVGYNKVVLSEHPMMVKMVKNL